MKANELIKYLKEMVEKFGDQDVFVECFNEKIIRQTLDNLLANDVKFILVSKEATDAWMENDPLNSLPIIDIH